MTLFKQNLLTALSWILALVVAMSSSSSTTALSSAAPSKSWLVVDFDGTCTVRDTITMLPRLASLAQSQKEQQTGFNNGEALSPDAAMELQGRLSIFSMLENEYFRQYRDAMESIEPEAVDENDDENLEKLATSIDKLDDVSTSITHEVSNWRVLGGLGDVSSKEMLELMDLYKQNQAMLEPKKIGGKEIDLEELRECLSLQDGCLSVLQNFASQDFETRQNSIGVLSINWCPALIESLLVHPLCAANNDLEVSIWCNSVDGEGIVDLPYPGAIAKQQKIKELQENNDSSVIYVGDSSTDLLAILQADVGILLGGSQSAMGLAQRYGMSVHPLNEYRVKGVEEKEKVVWTTDSWEEIRSFLEEYQFILRAPKAETKRI